MTNKKAKAKATAGADTNGASGLGAPFVVSANRVGLVLRHRRVDFLGPGEDAAGQVGDVREARCLEGD